MVGGRGGGGWLQLGLRLPWGQGGGGVGVEVEVGSGWGSRGGVGGISWAGMGVEAGSTVLVCRFGERAAAIG